MTTTRSEGLTLRQAALIVGLAYLLNPVTYAEFSIYPKLIIPGQLAQTVANIASNHGLAVAMFFCYYINFIGDIVIAWGLYILLAPVNRAVSGLAALFQLVYAAVAFVGLFNLATVYRMLTTPEYATAFGQTQLQAQVDLLLHAWRYNYVLVLILFGIHLIIAGVLIARSTYIPRWLGVILIINGFAWIISSLKPYLYPDANLGFIFVLYFGEVIFMLWLLIWGWRIREPVQQPLPS